MGRGVKYVLKWKPERLGWSPRTGGGGLITHAGMVSARQAGETVMVSGGSFGKYS